MIGTDYELAPWVIITLVVMGMVGFIFIGLCAGRILWVIKPVCSDCGCSIDNGWRPAREVRRDHRKVCEQW
jgi:hypothetical protein